VQPNEITDVLRGPLSQELLARDLTRLAYVAKDGTSRLHPAVEPVAAVRSLSQARPELLIEVTEAYGPVALSRWRRIVDGLVVAGDSRAVALQRIEE